MDKNFATAKAIMEYTRSVDINYERDEGFRIKGWNLYSPCLCVSVQTVVPLSPSMK